MPDSLLTALRLTYGRNCCKCQTPLKVSHLMAKHGLLLGLDAALELYQKTQTRSKGRQAVQTIISMALQLGQTHNGRPLTTRQ